MSIQPGAIIADRYCIEELLDEGGIGKVYRARHTGTGKPCALKLIHSHLLADDHLGELFRREAQVGGKIGDNPYIVNVFDAGFAREIGAPYLAMELLKGETLERYAERHGPVDPAVMVRLFRQLGDALDQAHAAGVVHRDIKPSNLFITHNRKGEMELRVMDFGIAKFLEESPPRTATVIGTPQYAAPEQLGPAYREFAAERGITIARGVSAETDVWPLGLLAYEMLTGHPPGHYWNAKPAEIPAKVAFKEMPCASIQAVDRAHHLPSTRPGRARRPAGERRRAGSRPAK